MPCAHCSCFFIFLFFSLFEELIESHSPYQGNEGLTGCVASARGMIFCCGPNDCNFTIHRDIFRSTHFVYAAGWSAQQSLTRNPQIIITCSNLADVYSTTCLILEFSYRQRTTGFDTAEKRFCGFCFLLGQSNLGFATSIER